MAITNKTNYQKNPKSDPELIVITGIAKENVTEVKTSKYGKEFVSLLFEIIDIRNERGDSINPLNETEDHVRLIFWKNVFNEEEQDFISSIVERQPMTLKGFVVDDLSTINKKFTPLFNVRKIIVDEEENEGGEEDKDNGFGKIWGNKK